MPIIVPLIVGAIALGSGAMGAYKSVSGIRKWSKANDILKTVNDKYEKELQETSKSFEALEKVLERIGNKKSEASELRRKSIKIISRYIEKLKVKALALSQDKTISVDDALKRLKDEEISLIEMENILEGITKSVGAYGAALTGAKGMAIAIGTASTGTPISALKGEALRRAILAWFGGGSLASGGGGMLLGSIVLNALGVGTGLLFAGSTLEKHAEKKLTEAKAYEAKIEAEIKKLRIIRNNINHFKKWLTEVYEKALDRLLHSAKILIEELEKLEKKNLYEKVLDVLIHLAEVLKLKNKADIPEHNLRLIQQLYLVNRALRDILEIDLIGVLENILQTEIYDKRLKELELQIDRILKGGIS